MTLQEMLKWGETQLQESGIYEYSSDAWILFSYCFQMERVEFMMNCVNYIELEPIRKEQWQQYQQAIAIRITGKPVQYITKEQNFYGYDFYVDERVLIPRQDTEVLIECVEQTMRQVMLHKKQAQLGRLLDMCTGSGCIAITLSNVLEWEEVMAVDVSEDALEVAAKNNQQFGNRVKLVQSDLFANVQGTFDVIVSNPPYIETAVIETLSTEVKQYEPRLALDGKEDGLYFYRIIISKAREYLKKEGFLFLEIGYNQAEAVKQLCYDWGYEDVRVVADLAGLQRVVCAQMK